MKILVFNPGGNSLKAELVKCSDEQRYAFEGESLLSVTIEGIGKAAELSTMKGKEKAKTERIDAKDYEQAAGSLLQWWDGQKEIGQATLEREKGLMDVGAIAIRVVHGGWYFDKPALIDKDVLEKIMELEKLAPLHNKSSVEVMEPIRTRFAGVPVYAVFDTAFHRTIPDHAALYAIPLELAERHHIRRYGFHGISHRYLLERYAHLAGKDPSECNVVSMHLESGCSVTAIQHGRSVDNTMGLTPLEGLMMGTRSGNVDPSLVALLMREEDRTIDEVMTFLNKESGLKGVSGDSLDTRVLMKKYDSDPKVKLAMDMFCYRVRTAVGAYIAALGSVDAVIFGGGIAENGILVRRVVSEGLRGFGLELNEEANDSLIDVEGILSTQKSRLKAWVIPTQEGLQLAQECFLAANGR
jgi:acetate kinase